MITKLYIILTFFFSISLISQSKQDLINAINSKVNYEFPYHKLQSGLVYDKIFDEYGFYSVFTSNVSTTKFKISYACKSINRDDIVDIIINDNKILVTLKEKKCTSVEEIDKNTKVIDTYGFPFLLTEDTSLNEAQKFKSILKLIFEKD